MESVDKSGTLNIDEVGPEKLINSVGMSVAKDGLSFCRALLRRRTSIPEHRKWELLDTVAQYCGCSAEDLTDDLIQHASEVNPK